MTSPGSRRATTGSRDQRPVNLALQGGGSHGAFTWGVLDRLLEDGRIEFEAVSGTSAGAMNAVVLAEGLIKGGADGARAELLDFWEAVSRAATGSPLQRTPLNMFFGNWSLDDSPGYLFMDMLSRVASPYDLNPLNIRWPTSSPNASILSGSGPARRRSCLSRQPMFIPAAYACLKITRSRPIRSWRLPVCRSCSRP